MVSESYTDILNSPVNPPGNPYLYVPPDQAELNPNMSISGFIDESGQESCKGGRRETTRHLGGPKQINQGRGEGRRNWSWSGSRRKVCRGPGESISYHVLRPRDVDHGACELSQVGEVVLLAGRPCRRYSKQSMSEQFVVSENG